MSFLGLGAVLGWMAPIARADKPISVTKGGQRTLGKEYTYDLGDLAKTDPKLLLYERTANLSVGLKGLRALAVSADGHIWAGGDEAVVTLDRSGAVLKSIAVPSPVRCLAVAPDQRLWIGLPDRLGVVVSGGSFKEVGTSLGAKVLLTSIAVGESDVFVADAANRVVLRLDPTGKVIKMIGRKDAGRNIPGLIVPSPYLDLALGPEGLLWVANPGRHQLEAYSWEGDLELSWGETSNSIRGFCGCCNPVHFARLPDGRFVTSEKGLTRVKIYSEKGQFVGVVAGPEEFPRYLALPAAKQISAGLEVAADPDGWIWVADGLEGIIRGYRAKGGTAG